MRRTVSFPDRAAAVLPRGVQQEPKSVYAVLLFRPDNYAASGAYVYRARELPPLNGLIEVEEAESRIRVWARVTRVSRRCNYAIDATIEQPWPLTLTEPLAGAP